jgi:hypothetical protein
LLALLVLGLAPAVLVPQVRLEAPRPPVPAISRVITTEAGRIDLPAARTA